MAAPLALLFDLDGTLVDTDPLHLAAFNRLLGRFGRAIDMTFYKTRIMGAPNVELASLVFPELPPPEAMGRLGDKEAYFRELVGMLEPLAGLAGLLRWAAERQLPTAVVTNAPRANAELLLAGLGLSERFDHLVIADELARPKPDPLPYITALKLVGVGAAQAVVFEDSLSGVRAGAAAGIPVIGLRTGLDDAQLKAAGAVLTIADFADPALAPFLAAQLS